MGNTCSKTTTQPDSTRVQEDNTSNEPSEVREPFMRMLSIPGAPNNWEINYKVLIIDGKHTVTIFVMKHKLKNDGTVEPRFIPICFFKMEESPSKITFEMSENQSFSITAYISEETSGEIAVHSITWESNEYTIQEDGVFIGCVKKIQRTDCHFLFVSSLKPKSLSGEEGASSASENVSSSNGSQIEVSKQVGLGQGGFTVSQTQVSLEVHSAQLVSSDEIDNGAGASALQANVQPLSVNSHDNGSATHAPEFVSIGSGAGVSTLRRGVPPPEAVGRSLVNRTFKPQYLKMIKKIMHQNEMLQQIMSRGKVDPSLCFPQCDSCINKSAKNARNDFGRMPVITFDDRSVSDSILPRVIKSDVINIYVNGVDVSLILTLPKDVIREIACLYRVNCPDVLGTVSRLINQCVELLQLDCDPSKTSLVLSDAVCDNRHRFLLWICRQMRLNISRLERPDPSEDTTSCVCIAPCVDASSAVKDVYHRQEFERCGPVEESTTRRNIKRVGNFSGNKHLFTVLEHSNQIVYTRLDWDSLQNIANPVQFGIINISSLMVHELSDGVYLIVIQTESGQTYLSGYLSTNATACFATCQITSNLEERRFKSFEHVSGTVFKCLFSDGTERTFSIEYGSYATINEVLNA